MNTDQPIAGIDDLDSISPHTDVYDVVVITLTRDECRVLMEVLDVNAPADLADEPIAGSAWSKLEAAR